MSDRAERASYETFLFLKGAYIVQWLLALSVVGNGLAGMGYFRAGRPLFGLWALAATVLLPRATLALFLIAERDGNLAMNLTPLLGAMYSRTIARYGSPSLAYETYHRGDGVRGAYLREVAQLALWSAPFCLAF